MCVCVCVCVCVQIWHIARLWQVFYSHIINSADAGWGKLEEITTDCTWFSFVCHPPGEWIWSERNKAPCNYQAVAHFGRRPFTHRTTSLRKGPIFNLSLSSSCLYFLSLHSSWKKNNGCFSVIDMGALLKIHCVGLRPNPKKTICISGTSRH